MPQKAKPRLNAPKAAKPQTKKSETQTLDATGKILGRLATEAANLVRGKNKPGFRPYLISGDKVIITNAAKVRVTGNKLETKQYWRHSGYLGNLKSETMAELMRRNPSEVVRRAIKGMLPKNKLQDKFMKNLEIYNGEINGAN